MASNVMNAKKGPKKNVETTTNGSLKIEDTSKR